MKRFLLGATVLILAAAVAAPTVVQADPPPWAPAHGWRAKHQYTYYPRGEVYYARDTHMWFWLDGGNWRSGLRLPGDFQAFVQVGGISIELGSERPYVEHTYVVEHYGGRPPRYMRHDRDRDHDRGDRGHHGRDDDDGRGRGQGHGKHGH